MSGVLVVQEGEILPGLVQVLERGGLRVAATTSACELPFVLSRVDPEVLVIDLSVNPVTRNVLLHALRQRRLKTNAALLLFGDEVPSELARLTEELGADGFVCKSETADQIVRKIQFWSAQRLCLAGARDAACG